MSSEEDFDNEDFFKGGWATPSSCETKINVGKLHPKSLSYSLTTPAEKRTHPKKNSDKLKQSGLSQQRTHPRMTTKDKEIKRLLDNIEWLLDHITEQLDHNEPVFNFTISDHKLEHPGEFKMACYPNKATKDNDMQRCLCETVDIGKFDDIIRRAIFNGKIPNAYMPYLINVKGMVAARDIFLFQKIEDMEDVGVKTSSVSTRKNFYSVSSSHLLRTDSLVAIVYRILKDLSKSIAIKEITLKKFCLYHKPSRQFIIGYVPI